MAVGILLLNPGSMPTSSTVPNWSSNMYPTSRSECCMHHIIQAYDGSPRARSACQTSSMIIFAVELRTDQCKDKTEANFSFCSRGSC